jgi:hypothetical protein
MKTEQHSSYMCPSHALTRCLGLVSSCSSADAPDVEDTNNTMFHERHPTTSSSYTVWRIDENLSVEAGGCPTAVSTPVARERCSRRSTDTGDEGPEMDSKYDSNRLNNHMSNDDDLLEVAVGCCNMSPDVSFSSGQIHNNSGGHDEVVVVDSMVASTSRLPSREILHIFEMAYPGVCLSDQEDADMPVNRSSGDDARCVALDQCVAPYPREDLVYTESQCGIDMLMSNLAEDQHDEYEVHPHGSGYLCYAYCVAPAA